MSKFIKNLIREDESLYLEYKSEWYWDNDSKPTDRQWGEFLKDFVALVNCHVDYVDSNKYLVIGIKETENDLNSRIIDTQFDLKNNLTSDSLKTKIIEKINEFFYTDANYFPVYKNFSLKYHKIDNKQILVFEIKPTKKMLVLKKDLLDKNRTEKKNNVFIRGIKEKGDPEVLNASPSMLKKLEERMKKHENKLLKEERKEKSIEKTINLYVQNNSIFSLANPKKERIWKENILYEIYPVKSDFSNIDFIYIFKNTSQQRTYNYLKDNKILTYQAQRWILIDDELNKDINGIKNKFEATKVFSIDKFALEYLYKDYLDSEIYYDGSFKKQRQVKNFVEPFTTDSNEKNAFTILSEWFVEPSQPLMVIKGYGGVGKTTLVKYFLDEIYEQNKKNHMDSKILFIDSKEIINSISRQEKVDSIYDFYEALTKKKELSKKFNKELLELSVDNGNLIIILDGIDEVIAKLGDKFNTEKFITTIYDNYSLGNEKTKIIITCRDYFWDKNIKTTRNLKTIELKAFNEELTKKFFQKEFDKDSNEFRRCISLSKEFALSNEQIEKERETIYIPYILDVIMDIVKRKKEFGEVNQDNISSKILNIKLSNDYFIGRICDREIEKLQNLDIDAQIKFFINMAVIFNGEVPNASISKLLRSLPKQDDDLIEKFKGHTLVSYENNILYFKYDFFREYFMNIYISDFFIKKDNIEMSDDLQDIINEYIKYDNSFTEFICSRFEFNDELQIFVIDIIKKWIKQLKTKEDIKLRQLISAMLILLLVSLRLSNNKNDTETRTQLLINIFGENLEYLSLINLFGENIKKHPTFDFKDKTIKNAWFENYEYFWECGINENTRYYKSTFKHLIPRESVSIPIIHQNLFENCNTLDIEDILNEQETEKENKKEDLEKKVKKIFRHFEQGGTFKEKKVDDTRKKCDTKILDVLINKKVIHPYKNPKKPSMKQYKISDEYFDLIKILTQRGTCVELERIYKMFE